jgi:hypothetical protein
MTSTPIKDLPCYARLDQAVEWSLAHPEESFPTSSRIHHVKEKSIQSRDLCGRRAKRPVAGGQNRIPTDDQVTAIVQYCRESAE